jgi:hypothetical protein
MICRAAVLCFVGSVLAHPSGFGGGRTSCGREFSTPEDAYNIVKTDEAWYLRRIQTCDAPFFWTSWDITKVRAVGAQRCVGGWGRWVVLGSPRGEVKQNKNYT